MKHALLALLLTLLFSYLTYAALYDQVVKYNCYRSGGVMGVNICWVPLWRPY